MSERLGLSGQRLSRRFAVLLALGILFAASDGALAQSTEAADTTKIVIGSNGGGGISQVPINVALEKGLFKNAGLDVEVQWLNGGTPATMAALAAGSVNILAVSAPEIIPYVAHKAVSGKAFAEIFDKGYDVVAAPEIKSIQDFKGKVIGISGPNSADYVFLVATLQHYGLSLSDVNFITSGGSFNRLAAISKGVIQGTAGLIAQRVEMAKVANILLKSADNPVGFPQVMFIGSSDLLANHKPLLKKFIAVMLEATQWMKTNPAETAAICAKSIQSTVEICTTSVALNFDRSVSSEYSWSSTYAVNVEGVKSALAVMATLDPTTKNLTFDDVADTSITGTKP